MRYLSPTLPVIPSLLDALPGHTAVLDKRGYVAGVNTAWRNFISADGLDLPDDGLGAHYLAVFDAILGEQTEERDTVVAAIDDILAGQRSEFYLEYPCHGPDGECWFAIRVAATEDGEAARMLITHENITQRKLAEGALQETNRTLRTLVDSSPLAIVAVDAGYRVIAWNPMAERLFGWTEDEALGELNPIVPDAEWGIFLENVGPVFQGEMVSDIELRRQRKDGVLVHVSVSESPLYDRNGKIYGAMAIFADITDRKRAESALQLREQEFRTLTENLPDVIVRFDRSYRRIYVNPAVEQVTGRPAEALLGRTHRESGMPEHISEFWETNLGRVFEAGQELTTNYEFVTPDGLRHYETRLAPEWGADGSIMTVLAISRDVTSRQWAEKTQHFLARAGELLTSSLDYETTLSKVARLIVSDIADWCVVTVADNGQHIRWLAAAHADPAKERLVRELEDRFPLDPPLPFGIPTVLHAGESELYEEISADGWMSDNVHPEHLQVLDELGLSSAMVVPLISRDRTIGALLLAYGDSGRRYNQDELHLAEELARRVSQAIDNASLYHEARGAELRYRGLVEQIPAVTLTFDNITMDNVPVFISPQVEDLLSYSPEEWSDRPYLWNERIHPEDREAVRALGHHSLVAGEPFVLEYRMIRRDGQVIWVRDEAALIDRENGQRKYWQAIVTNITEQKLAEEAIREHAHQQAAVADLGVRALEGVDQSTLMDEAVSLVTRTLGTDFCSVLECLSDGQQLEFRATSGWSPDDFGQWRVNSGQDSLAGYTLRSGAPVIVPDLRNETRFHSSSIMRERGDGSSVSVIIPGPDGPYGILETHIMTQHDAARI